MRVWITTCARDLELTRLLLRSAAALALDAASFTLCWTDGKISEEFPHVEHIPINTPQRDGERHKYAAVNASFRAALEAQRFRKQNFLFAEADCTFLKPGAVSLLEAHFLRQRTLMMGKLIFTPQPADPSLFPGGRTQLRANGVSVYSWEIADLLLPHPVPDDKPFDVWLSPVYISRLSPTDLIHNKAPAGAALADLPPRAVLEHGCKTGALAEQILARYGFPPK